MFKSDTSMIEMSGRDILNNTEYTPHIISDSQIVPQTDIQHYVNIMLAIFLSQTLGISNINIKYTPMANLYIDEIDKISQPISL